MCHIKAAYTPPSAPGISVSLSFIRAGLSCDIPQGSINTVRRALCHRPAWHELDFSASALTLRLENALKILLRQLHLLPHACRTHDALRNRLCTQAVVSLSNPLNHGGKTWRKLKRLTL